MAPQLSQRLRPVPAACRLPNPHCRSLLHAKVLTRDGKDAGNVEGAIVDPATNQIREIVVDKGGLTDRPRLVPFAEIAAASRDGDTLRFRLTEKEVDALPAHSPARYAALPAGWTPPAALDLPAGAYRQPAALVDTAPPREPASEAPPPETIYPAPDRGGVVHVSDATQMAVEKGAVVLDRSGAEIGVVDDLRLDSHSGQLMGFVLRVGAALRTFFGGGEVVEVTRSQIDRVDEGVIHLRLTKEEFERVTSPARG